LTQIINFHRWKELRLKQLKRDEKVLCPFCKGDLETEVECGECGEFRMVECDLPHDENGFVSLEHVDTRDISATLLRPEYESAVLTDAAALAEWMGKPIVNLLVENGFKPYSSLFNKKMYIGKRS